jgi:kinesin family protein 23
VILCVRQDKERVIVSQLALVDLAGSERTVRTNNTGERLREAGQINQSLMTLRTCIACLRDNQQSGANKVCGVFEIRVTFAYKHYVKQVVG